MTMDIDTLYADAIAGDSVAIEKLAALDHVWRPDDRTILHDACLNGNTERVKFILAEFAKKNLLFKVDNQKRTPLNLAAGCGHAEVVEILIDAARRILPSSATTDDPYNSPSRFEEFIRQADYQGNTALHEAASMNMATVKALVKADPGDRHVQNERGCTPLYLAVKSGKYDIVKILCENYEDGRTDHTGHFLLLKAIEKADKELVYHLLAYDKRLATYNSGKCLATYNSGTWTALHYAVGFRFDQVIEAIISAQRDVGYKLTNEESPLTVAVDRGYISTAVLLMNLLPATSSVYFDQSGQNILHIAVVQNNKDMIQTILAHCPKSLVYKILNGQDNDGNTPLHLLIAQGCFVPELIKHNLVDLMARNKKDQIPSDMLYFQEEVEADQAKIKKILDDAPTTRQFWRINIGGRWSNCENPGDTTKRLLKDLEFGTRMTSIVEEELQQWKEKIKPYRERTTTQIIVTALITTVTFTVGFTMPGGYHQSGEPEEGLVLLSKKKAFEVFMVSDASALALSITSLFIYFISSLYDDPHQVSKFDVASTVLNIISIIAMILTFIAGIYVVLSHSPGLALIVCIICSTFFLSLFVLLIKMMCDCKRRKIKV